MVKKNWKKGQGPVAPPIAEKVIQKRKKPKRKKVPKPQELGEDRRVKIKGIFLMVLECGSEAKAELRQNLWKMECEGLLNAPWASERAKVSSSSGQCD